MSIDKLNGILREALSITKDDDDDDLGALHNKISHVIGNLKGKALQDATGPALKYLDLFSNNDDDVIIITKSSVIHYSGVAGYTYSVAPNEKESDD